MDLTREQWLELAADTGAPRVTLTMPLEHEELTNEKNRIRWKNLVTEAERQLEQLGLRREDRRRLLAPARELMDRQELGEEAARGLAVLLSEDRQVVHWCPHPIRSEARVADRFELSPLIDHLLPTRPFYVLALASTGARLFRCGDHALQRVRLPSAPKDAAQANWAFDEPVPSGPMHGNTFGAGNIGGSAPLMSPQGFGHEDRWQIQMEAWLRSVHDAIREDVGALDGPLVLATVERVHGLWRTMFGEASCWPEPIRGNPELREPDDLAQEARALLGDALEVEDERVHRDRFFAARKDGRTAGRLGDLVRAAAEQRVETLFVRPGEPLYGRIHGEGTIERLGPADAGAVDLAAQIVLMTLLNGGRVLQVDELPEPGSEPVANAILRW